MSNEAVNLARQVVLLTVSVAAKTHDGYSAEAKIDVKNAADWLIDTIRQVIREEADKGR